MLDFPKTFAIGSQQLFELGWLLIALSLQEAALVDENSACELLERYGLKIPNPLENWADNPLSYNQVFPYTPAEYVSLWDDGIEVKSACTVNLATGEIQLVSTADVSGVDILKREYVVLPDGTERDVCTICHEWLTLENQCPSCGE